MQEDKEIHCKMCGKCCRYFKGAEVKKCKYLIILKNGKCYCKIYWQKDRVGKKLDKGVYCMNRMDSPYDFDGCPYNTNKPIRRFDYVQ